MAGLLVSVAVSANGVIPVLELDFTRSATETLKKIGISDACVIGASSPVAFTFCREGSSTLWKYQALDLEQMAALQDAKQSPAAYQPVSVVEFGSPACEHEGSLAASEKRATIRRLILGLIAMSLLIGLRYSYRAMRQRRQDPTAYAHPLEQASSEFQASAQAKALAAFGLAVAVAVVYFNYTGF